MWSPPLPSFLTPFFSQPLVPLGMSSSLYKAVRVWIIFALALHCCHLVVYVHPLTALGHDG
jgi:hypothetical protein